MSAAWLTVAGATCFMVVISYLCFRLYKIHMKASILCDCIADMLDEPERGRQREIAERTRLRLTEMGLWLGDA